MPKLINRAGQRFGKLVVIERVGTDKFKKVLWKCICDCGNHALINSGSLVTGNTASCGCIVPNFKHGGWNKSSYNTWRAMMRRCYNKTDKDYKKYGEQGISVSEEWHDYLNFSKDMGEPIGSQTLDRINPYGNYSKDNCRWATMPVQARNIRIKASSKSGVTGVTNVYGDKWMAKITVGKKAFYSKVFDSIDGAKIARKELEEKHWGGER